MTLYVVIYLDIYQDMLYYHTFQSFGIEGHTQSSCYEQYVPKRRLSRWVCSFLDMMLGIETQNQLPEGPGKYRVQAAVQFGLRFST